MTQWDIEKALAEIDATTQSRFSGLDRDVQLLMILSMEITNSTRLAILERKQIDFEEDNRLYRDQRERKENDKLLTTTAKIMQEIKKELGQRFDWGVYFRDKVLPSILTVIVLAILYLTFGVKP